MFLRFFFVHALLLMSFFARYLRYVLQLAVLTLYNIFTLDKTLQQYMIAFTLKRVG